MEKDERFLVDDGQLIRSRKNRYREVLKDITNVISNNNSFKATVTLKRRSINSPTVIKEKKEIIQESLISSLDETEIEDEPKSKLLTLPKEESEEETIIRKRRKKTVPSRSSIKSIDISSDDEEINKLNDIIDIVDTPKEKKVKSVSLSTNSKVKDSKKLKETKLTTKRKTTKSNVKKFTMISDEEDSETSINSDKEDSNFSLSEKEETPVRSKEKIYDFITNKLNKNCENSDNISSSSEENNFIKIGENESENDESDENKWKFLDNETIYRKKDNLTITVGDCIYLESEEIIKNKNCYRIYLITSIYRNPSNSNEEEIFIKTIPLKRQYDLFPFRNDDLELFLFIDNEECINLENVNIVKKCCVFFLPNLNYFYKIKNIYFLRDIYYCTKIVKLNENNKFIFRNLAESEWTNKEQLYNYCKLLQPQYFTTNNNLINNFTKINHLINNSINSNNDDNNKIIGLDLFCGCGGLSYGLEKTELIKIKYSIDLNRNALKTYKYNMNHCNVFLKDASFFLRKIKLINKLYELVQDCNNNSKNGNLNDNEEDVNIVMSESSIKSGVCENFCNEKFIEMERNNLFLEKILKIKFDKLNLKNLNNLKFKILNKNKTNLDKEYVNIRKLKQFKNYKQVLLEYLNTKYENYPKRGEIDLICGGPPCQGYTNLNRYKKKQNMMKHKDNKLTLIYLKFIKYFQPKYFIMENVPDMITTNNKHVFYLINKKLNKYNYKYKMGLLCSAQFGLPQKRNRIFYIGYNNNTLQKNTSQKKFKINFPIPTHALGNTRFPKGINVNENNNSDNYNLLKDKIISIPQHYLTSSLPPIHLIDFISDIYNCTNKEIANYNFNPQNKIQEYLRNFNLNNFSNLNNLNLNNLLLDHVYQSLPNKFLNSEILERDNENGISFSSKNLLKWNDFFNTVIGSVNVEKQKIIHPNYSNINTIINNNSKNSNHFESKYRICSIREFARGQGFPDSFKFFGNLKEKYKQIGNAVCTNIAYYLGMEIIKNCYENESIENLFNLYNQLLFNSNNESMNGNDFINEIVGNTSINGNGGDKSFKKKTKKERKESLKKWLFNLLIKENYNNDYNYNNNWKELIIPKLPFEYCDNDENVNCDYNSKQEDGEEDNEWIMSTSSSDNSDNNKENNNNISSDDDDSNNNISDLSESDLQNEEEQNSEEIIQKRQVKKIKKSNTTLQNENKKRKNNNSESNEIFSCASKSDSNSDDNSDNNLKKKRKFRKTVVTKEEQKESSDSNKNRNNHYNESTSDGYSSEEEEYFNDIGFFKLLCIHMENLNRKDLIDYATKLRRIATELYFERNILQEKVRNIQLYVNPKPRTQPKGYRRPITDKEERERQKKEKEIKKEEVEININLDNDYSTTESEN